MTITMNELGPEGRVAPFKRRAREAAKRYAAGMLVNAEIPECHWHESEQFQDEMYAELQRIANRIEP